MRSWGIMEEPRISASVAGGVAAEGLHLPEAVLRGDVALGDDEVVERGGLDVGDAVGVALDGDGSGEAGDGDGAVELREGCRAWRGGPRWRAPKKSRRRGG